MKDEGEDGAEVKEDSRGRVGPAAPVGGVAVVVVRKQKFLFDTIASASKECVCLNPANTAPCLMMRRAVNMKRCFVPTMVEQAQPK